MSQKYTYLGSMPPHRFVERHLVTLAIKELAKNGWMLREFEDEEHECTAVANAEEAWEAFDSVDMGWLHFDGDGTHSAWVLLIGGNGEDVISDCTNNIGAHLESVFLY